MAYVRHDQPTLAMYFELANSQAIIGISEDNVTAGGAIALPPTMAKNTKVVLSAVPGERFDGTFETFYNRIDMASFLADNYLSVDIPEGATSIMDVVQGLNERLGLSLTQDDIVDTAPFASEATVTFSNACYAYIGSIVVNVNEIAPDARQTLSSAITDVDVAAFSDPLLLNDYPMFQLERDAFAHNSLTAERNTVRFGLPVENTDSAHPGNTAVVMKSSENGAYSGETTIYYDRLELSDLFPEGLRIPVEAYPTLYGALDYILEEYGVYFTPLDIEDADLTVENPVATGKDNNLLLLPGTQMIIGEPIELENSFQGLDGEPILTMGDEPFVTIEDPNAPAPSPLEGISLVHFADFDSVYNTGDHIFTPGTHSSGSPSIEGTTTLDGLDGTTVPISVSGGTYDASDWEIGGDEMNAAVSAAAAWPVSDGQFTDVTQVSSFDGTNEYRWEYQSGPVYANPESAESIMYSSLEAYFAGEGSPNYVVIAPSKLIMVSSTDPSSDLAQGKQHTSFGVSFFSTETGTVAASDKIPSPIFSVVYPVA